MQLIPKHIVQEDTQCTIGTQEEKKREYTEQSSTIFILDRDNHCTNPNKSEFIIYDNSRMMKLTDLS